MADKKLIFDLKAETKNLKKSMNKAFVIIKSFYDKTKKLASSIGKIEGKSSRDSEAQIRNKLKTLKREENALKKKLDSHRKLTRSYEKLNTQSKKSGSIFKRLRVMATSLSVAIGVALTKAIGAAIQKLNQLATGALDQFKGVDTSFREINTLLAGKGGLTEATKDAIRQQSLLYGQDVKTNAKGFYDIVSSGFTDQAKALEILNIANKSAIAGVTDVATAVDGITTAMNVYKDANLSALEASDIFFKNVQLGKTTFPELAAAIGTVLPIAEKAGARFEDVAASIALLTAKGVSTQESMTLLKGVFKSIFKQSDEMKDTIREMGVSWDVSTLKTKGFKNMLVDLGKATGGSIEKLGKIIPDIRGLAGASTLATVKIKDFIEAFDDVGGVTEEAFNDMKGFQLEFNKETQKTKAILEVMGKSLSKGSLSVKRFGNYILGLTANVVALGKAFRKSDPGLFIEGLNKAKGSISSLYGTMKKEFPGTMKFLEEATITGIENLKLGIKSVIEGLGQLAGVSIDQESLKKDKEEIKKIINFKEPKTQETKSESISKEKEIIPFGRTLSQSEELKVKLKEIGKTFEDFIDDIGKGVKKLVDVARKELQKIKDQYSGKSFGILGSVSKDIGDDSDAQSQFRRLIDKIEDAFKAEDIRKVADVAKQLADSSFSTKSSFDSLLTEIKTVKGTLTADDLVGAMKAAEFNFTLGDSFNQELIRNLKEGLEGQRQEVLVEFEKGVKELLEGHKDINKIFGDNVHRMKGSIETFADSVVKSLNSKVNINLSLKDDLKKFIYYEIQEHAPRIVEQEFEKQQNNKTLNRESIGG